MLKYLTNSQEENNMVFKVWYKRMDNFMNMVKYVN